MALFKIATDNDGCKLKYKEEKDLYNLIDYCIRDSKHTERLGVISDDPEMLTNQFLFIQNGKGEELDTRALHFILSYDSTGWEWEMNIQKTIESISTLLRISSSFLAGHQTIIVAHDNDKNCNIHIIVNPVNMWTRKIFHYSPYELKAFLKELASNLYMIYGLALSGVSYIGENGRCYWGSNHFLYENRQYASQKLKSKNMK